MATEVKGKEAPRTRKAIEHTMKVAQRELEDSMLKVRLLELLLKGREMLDDGKG